MSSEFLILVSQNGQSKREEGKAEGRKEGKKETMKGRKKRWKGGRTEESRKVG